jgi:spore coat protein U-like protein
MNVKNKAGRVRIAYLSGYVEIPRGGVCYPATHILLMVTFLDCIETLLSITRKPCGRGNMPCPAEGFHKPRNRVFTALLFLALGILAGPAYAITCTVTTTSVNFGNYTTTTATPNDSVGTVTTHCSNNGQTSIATDISLSTGFGTYAQRTMKSGSNLLNYNLYTNASRATVWTNVVPSEGHANYQVDTTPIDKIFSVYGRIPALQNVPIGTYTDTIIVTVNY